MCTQIYRAMTINDVYSYIWKFISGLSFKLDKNVKRFINTIDLIVFCRFDLLWILEKWNYSQRTKKIGGIGVRFAIKTTPKNGNKSVARCTKLTSLKGNIELNVGWISRNIQIKQIAFANIRL